MAGFDADTQRSAQLPNVKMNFGMFEFSSGSETIDVPTTLAKAFGGAAMADLTATTDPQQTMVGYKVGDVSNGAVTFTRGGGHVDEDARMSYWLFGW